MTRPTGPTVLMLTPWMKMGYGVAEAVASLSRGLTALGYPTVVGALGEDGSFADVDVREITPDAARITALAARLGASVAVAHGSPFFEVLPELPMGTIAYEYGDPTPQLFEADAEERSRIAAAKRTQVYPAVGAVACISNFIRHDIGWPDARVIPLGIEHIPDLGPKPLVPPVSADRPLRVGTLMRLGAGEAHYKGNHLLPALRVEVHRHRPATQFEVMGRGTEADATVLRDAGFLVHLNASDHDRQEFLRTIDVFVSPSQWEGCNLPLVEAQALGTPGLAFDTGAHPEFTPLVFPSLNLLARQIVAYDDDRSGLLRQHGRAGYTFVRETMSWEQATHRLADLIREVDPGPAPARPPLGSQLRVLARRTKAAVKEHGAPQAAKLAVRKVVPKKPPTH